MMVGRIVGSICLLLGWSVQAQESPCERSLAVVSYNLHTTPWWEWAQRWSVRRAGVIEVLRDGPHELLMLQGADSERLADLRESLSEWRIKGDGTLAIGFRQDRWNLIEAPERLLCPGGSGQFMRLAPRQNLAAAALSVVNLHLVVPSDGGDAVSLRRIVESCLTGLAVQPQIVALSLKAEDTFVEDRADWEQFLQAHELSDAETANEPRKTSNAWWGVKWTTKGRRDILLSRSRGLPVTLDLDQRRYQGAYPSRHFALKAKICLHAGGSKTPDLGPEPLTNLSDFRRITQ